MERNEVIRLVEAELSKIRDVDRRAALSASVVSPEPHIRTWAYVPGEYECWTVARGPKAVLVYSQGAFADSWGAIEDDSDDLGMDSEWYTTLDDAFIRGIWTGPLPPGYEVA